MYTRSVVVVNSGSGSEGVVTGSADVVVAAADVGEESSRVAAVLGEHDVRAGQDLDGAGTEVGEVADRGRDDGQGAAHASSTVLRWTRLGGGDRI